MANDNLENLVRIGQLKKEPTREEEVTGLIRSGSAQLADSKKEDLSLESRFSLAYGAAHAYSLAALRKLGYRSENRYTVFLCLKHTLGIEDTKWRVLDDAHRRRNLAEYEGAIDLTESLVQGLIDAVSGIAERLPE
jgi:hypothetical protein